VPWANEIPYGGRGLFSVTIAACLLIALLLFSSTDISRLLQNIMAGGYLLIAALRLSACLLPRPDMRSDMSPDTRSDTRPSHVQSGLLSHWPTVCVLVPLYREDAVVQRLILHLSKLDYPKDRLDICLICEPDDPQTLQAIPQNLAAPFRVVIATDSGPKTKPKALNDALAQTQAYPFRSDFVTIYDAEDRPHPAQIKTAMRAFHAHPEWDALQAPLTFYNANQKLLTRQFALEYAALFFVWLPFLARLSCPFPLGGTSNFIRRQALDRLGGWDSYNVTEDADLSFRLAALGGKLGYIHPATSEEIVEDWTAWRNQRSRWMKGFIQTWRVQMRAAFAPGGWAGIRRQLTLQVTLGITLFSNLFHLPFVVYMLGLAIWSGLSGSPLLLSAWAVYCLILSYSAGLMTGIVGAVRSGQYRLIPDVIFMPFYWLAFFVPTLSALWELKNKPFYWNKTQHGVTDAPH